MYKIAEVIGEAAKLAPPGLAAPWDNPGLLLGDVQKPCSAVLVALDLSLAVVAQAQELGCQLILTHHPFIFAAQKQVLAGTYEGDLVLALARAGIGAFAAHTNWDNANGGINYALAEALGLQEPTPILDPNSGAGEILLLAGDLPRAAQGAELLELVRNSLGLPLVRAAGLEPDKMYQRLAVVGGAGMDFWQEARAAGCDALVSAEGKHHQGVQAVQAGFCLVDATHFATEIMGIRRLGQLLGKELPDLQIFYAREQDSWAFYGRHGERL